MAIRLFDTLSDHKVELVPIVPGEVGLYVCGPTVYAPSHIGHGRCYVVWDTVVRYLRHRGLKVTHVRNYTDIDDKIIRAAAQESETPIALARRFADSFDADMKALGNEPPDVTPRVSEHIPDILRLIERLITGGHAYESSGDVYFAVRNYPPYGKLSHRNIDDMKAGAGLAERQEASQPARPEPGEQKRDPLDFALWKAAKPGEISWDSPWGKGRPGWHIECSAMSARYLGDSFDIHAGGKDLVFPHHENELAQSEAASHKPFSRYWMHNGFVVTRNAAGDEEKMAKSGSFSTIQKALETVDGQAMRLFLLSTHYRAPIQFSETAVFDAQKRIEYIYETLAKIDTRLVTAPTPEGDLLEPERVKGLLDGFHEAMDDDFNTAEALGRLSAYLAWLNELNEKPPAGAAKPTVRRTIVRLRADVEQVLRVLGFHQDTPTAVLGRIRVQNARRRNIDSAEVERAIVERADARKARDFARADAIRQRLADIGVEIMDTPQGTTWRVV
jgi:cysteinyl-tRNA synthetase